MGRRVQVGAPLPVSQILLAPSFQSPWYWTLHVVVWTIVCLRTLGVPYDMLLRARRLPQVAARVDLLANLTAERAQADDGPNDHVQGPVPRALEARGEEELRHGGEGTSCTRRPMPAGSFSGRRRCRPSSAGSALRERRPVADRNPLRCHRNFAIRPEADNVVDPKVGIR